MALKFLAGNRIQGTAAERAATLSAPLTDPLKTGGFVMDLSWYRGSNDTSGTSNNDSNRVFISSNTAGYVQSGQTSTDRQIGFMLSSGHTHGIMNKGSSGEYWASASNNIQATGSWRYFRIIFDDSANTYQWYRFTSESDRNAMTVSSHTNSEAGVSASADAGTNFDTGKDLKYLSVTALDNGGSATDFKIDDIKFWKNTEDAVTGSPTPDIHITFADGTGWTGLSGLGSVTGGELVMTGDSATPAYYTIPNVSSITANTIFEETDTGKHYMLNSATGWVEVT